MTSPSPKSIDEGQKIYTPLSLKIYNLMVLKFSNQFIWRCPSSDILDFYNQHVSANHCDVGVGTGYFLKHCNFPSKNPDLTLVDINPHCLKHTAKELHYLKPKTHQADIYKPLPSLENSFDSIGLNYVLHCLPGDMNDKGQVIENLKACLRPSGKLFGTTILQEGVPSSYLAKKLRALYNKKGIFHNDRDSLSGLKSILEKSFSKVELRTQGVVAFFSATK